MAILSDSGAPEAELDRLVDSITASLRPYIKSAVRRMAAKSPENARILCDFITAEQNEVNIRDSTREWKIKVIVWLSQFFEHEKSYKDMTKQDILAHLNKFRRPEASDPTHRWVGTYNNRFLALYKFFRWLYNPDEPDWRQRVTPPCMTGVRRLPRKEKSPYKPEDLWTNEDHAIFLKYCPSKRDRCYHAMAHDTSARPVELLSLRIKDLNFKISPEGIRYAEVTVFSGKSRPRTLPLITSIPYIRDWLADHPQQGNPNAPLFVSMSDRVSGTPLTRNALWTEYAVHYRKEYFPRLLRDPSVPEEDKDCIKNLLTKPFSLYIQRHSALTEKAQILKESTLRDHAGWTQSSDMPQVYIHFYGNESSRSLLQAYGINKAEQQKQRDLLKPMLCPDCNEPNKPGARFCYRCKRVLTYDAHVEATTEVDRKMQAIREEMAKEFRLIHEKIDLTKLRS